ncbi:DNA-binding transcriptional regulator, AcrR family [Evansella caseinilytica]|uniref:DNA-binding transcriptional regulator, AcrR family n=1 Tax=Evansella caseinilytica TaxID=1503961 RepID=A0A1H3UWH3_9BACI|nr:TetR/AcrR family transcriptional regulator [Evansella caseinilytica]SDZ66784.1 DNA-binding transcriptional regulator, AcrR family [Evansella caseinilytica]
MVSSSFFNLDPEKQQRIINAAMSEFSKKGYKLASTNEIVKEASIGKGRLFHYFNSKKEMYFFLLEQANDIIEKIYAEMDLTVTDFFKRIEQIGVIKYNIYKQYPDLFPFLKSLAEEADPQVKEDLEKMKEHIFTTGFERIYENIDFSKFRDDIDLEKTLNIINWAMLSLGEKQRNSINTIDDYGTEHVKELEEYFELMKRCFYKQEEI